MWACKQSDDWILHSWQLNALLWRLWQLFQWCGCGWHKWRTAVVENVLRSKRCAAEKRFTSVVGIFDIHCSSDRFFVWWRRHRCTWNHKFLFSANHSFFNFIKIKNFFSDFSKSRNFRISWSLGHFLRIRAYYFS